MKVFIHLVLLFSSLSAFSQSPFLSDSTRHYTYGRTGDSISYPPTIIAQFPEGLDSLEGFIKNHLIYPDVAWTDNIQGKVTCRFLVSKEGHISDINVIKGLSLDADSEAIRVITLLPDMMPTTYHNEIQQTSSVLHIPFVKPKIYDHVDMQPEYPGGSKELMNKMKQVPHPTYSGGVMGKVIFTIVVGDDGCVLYATTDKKWDPQYQRDIRTFFRGFPKFKPAMLAGKPVSTTITIPVEIYSRK